jgi:hypothetical protein
MRQWTQAERVQQSQLIQKIRPWEKSTGPRTLDGKEKSKMNSFKDGTYTLEGNSEYKYVRTLIQMARILYKKPRGT